MKPITKEKLFLFMSIWDDPDLPNGAWQQCIEDAVSNYNAHYKTNFDPFDSFMEYIHSKDELGKLMKKLLQDEK